MPSGKRSDCRYAALVLQGIAQLQPRSLGENLGIFTKSELELILLYNNFTKSDCKAMGRRNMATHVRFLFESRRITLPDFNSLTPFISRWLNTELRMDELPCHSALPSADKRAALSSILSDLPKAEDVLAAPRRTPRAISSDKKEVELVSTSKSRPARGQRKKVKLVQEDVLDPTNVSLKSVKKARKTASTVSKVVPGGSSSASSTSKRKVKSRSKAKPKIKGLPKSKPADQPMIKPKIQASSLEKTSTSAEPSNMTVLCSAGLKEMSSQSEPILPVISSPIVSSPDISANSVTPESSKTADIEASRLIVLPGSSTIVRDTSKGSSYGETSSEWMVVRPRQQKAEPISGGCIVLDSEKVDLESTDLDCITETDVETETDIDSAPSAHLTSKRSLSHSVEPSEVTLVSAVVPLNQGLTPPHRRRLRSASRADAFHSSAADQQPQTKIAPRECWHLPAGFKRQRIFQGVPIETEAELRSWTPSKGTPVLVKGHDSVVKVTSVDRRKRAASTCLGSLKYGFFCDSCMVPEWRVQWLLPNPGAYVMIPSSDCLSSSTCIAQVLGYTDDDVLLLTLRKAPNRWEHDSVITMWQYLMVDLYGGRKREWPSIDLRNMTLMELFVFMSSREPANICKHQLLIVEERIIHSEINSISDFKDYLIRCANSKQDGCDDILCEGVFRAMAHVIETSLRKTG